MKILLLMDPFIPVPPVHYGGIERVIYDIACNYVALGHQVTLVAGPNSKSPDRLIKYGANGNGSAQLNFGVLNDVRRILQKELRHHDVIHNFGRLAFLFPFAWSGIRKVQTYMRYITPANVRWLNRIGCRNITYTAVSDAIVKTGVDGGGEWKTVYNCAPVNQYVYKEKTNEDAPLVFLGRLERCKGVHNAIEVAKRSGRNLIIAGNVSVLREEQNYFETEVKPRVDGRQIRYIGAVNDKEKNDLLGSAAAMLLPVEWYEPFPVVLPEAFACGTPVLAFPGGGIPEGIEVGKTGLLSKSVSEMAEHVNQIPNLSRSACRRVALETYSDAVIAKNYLSLYQKES